MYARPYLMPDGSRRTVWLEQCRCTKDEQHGPVGGVCGRCGGAIEPTGFGLTQFTFPIFKDQK